MLLTARIGIATCITMQGLSKGELDPLAENTDRRLTITENHACMRTDPLLCHWGAVSIMLNGCETPIQGPVVVKLA